MNHPDDIAEVKQKRICHECVGESYLSNDIATTGVVATCTYCGTADKSWSVEELADSIESAFDDHYRRTSDQPNTWQQTLMSDRESSYNWYRDGEPVRDAIENAAEVSQEVAEDVLAILDDRHGDFDSAAMGEETEFSSDTHYEEKSTSDQAWHEEWRDFETSLKTEARFFSRTATTHLTSVFGGIDQLKTKSGRPLVIGAGPQLALDHLYRARVFQSGRKLEEALCRPDAHRGSPPSALATAGRMNARGISVFYGATDAAVAVAEVRPPVGSSVAIARFNIIRPLRLLDLTALDDVQDGGSIFDSSLKARLERVAFLQTLGRRMTRPVMPDDEAFEYLATQAVADFLATTNEPQFDGIVFRSAQSKEGRNVVLFHKAARAEKLSLPKGTEIEARTGYETEDGWEVDYAVVETVPKDDPAPPKGGDDDDFPFSFLPGLPLSDDGDYRGVALRIDPASVVVHAVEWVKYHTDAFPVTRDRHEKHDWKR